MKNALAETAHVHLDPSIVFTACGRVLAILNQPPASIEVQVDHPGEFQYESERLFGAPPTQSVAFFRQPRVFPAAFWQDCRTVADSGAAWNIADCEELFGFVAARPNDDSGIQDKELDKVKSSVIRIAAAAHQRTINGEPLSSAAKEFQRQQFRKAINDLLEEGRVEHEKDLVEMRKQPGFAPLLADPQWQQLESDWRSTVSKYQERRAKWHGKFYEDLAPAEQAEERQLTNEQEREMADLRWRAYKLQQAYGVHSPDPLRTPDQLVKAIRVWQMWGEVLNQPGDNPNQYLTERAAEARKAALLLRFQFPALISVPLPLTNPGHDLSALLDWAITANRATNGTELNALAANEEMLSTKGLTPAKNAATYGKDRLKSPLIASQGIWARSWRSLVKKTEHPVIGGVIAALLVIALGFVALRWFGFSFSDFQFHTPIKP
jgi:hypothetical protein